MRCESDCKSHHQSDGRSSIQSFPKDKKDQRNGKTFHDTEPYPLSRHVR